MVVGPGCVYDDEYGYCIANLNDPLHIKHCRDSLMEPEGGLRGSVHICVNNYATYHKCQQVPHRLYRLLAARRESLIGRLQIRWRHNPARAAVKARLLQEFEERIRMTKPGVKFFAAA